MCVCLLVCCCCCFPFLFLGCSLCERDIAQRQKYWDLSLIFKERDFNGLLYLGNNEMNIGRAFI